MGESNKNRHTSNTPNWVLQKELSTKTSITNNIKSTLLLSIDSQSIPFKSWKKASIRCVTDVQVILKVNTIGYVT